MLKKSSKVNKKDMEEIQEERTERSKQEWEGVKLGSYPFEHVQEKRQRS